MKHLQSDPVYQRLAEKVRLVEKSGQKNTVHHLNLLLYIEQKSEEKKRLLEEKVDELTTPTKKNKLENKRNK